MTNESALLGLLADLYRDRAAVMARCDVLQAENEQLRQELAEATETADAP